MKVKFWWDSGANIHSLHEIEIDLAEYWGVSEEEARIEWYNMSDIEKYKEAEEIAYQNGLDIGWEDK